MARYTTAYSSFSAQLREVELLCARAAEIEKLDPIRRRAEINALCRAAIVLLCARVEAYIKELGRNVLLNLHTRRVHRSRVAEQFFYHVSKDALEEIRDTNDPAKIANKVFQFIQSDGEMWSLIGPFVQPLPSEQFNKGFSNPKIEKVCAYFNRFGYESHKRDLANALRVQYPVTINMVDHLVDIRNQIAHGDPTATKPPADVRDMIRIIRVYCSTTDGAFARWCKINLCVIR